MEAVILLAIAIPAFLLAASLYWLDRLRRRDALFRWASASGYRLLSFKPPFLSEASQFPISASKAQPIFRVEIESNEGLQSGWVRLGSAWRGLSSDVAEVRWKSS
jgi:hypothetical protein